jgi:uncharacterized protein YndB with AHSA1/START domain
MTDRSVTHATFCIERTLPASPARVFRAFADQQAKDKWFTGAPHWVRTERSMDFRIGGRETSSVGEPGGVQHRFDATYYDIIPNERIVFSYAMRLDEVLMSVSITTIELAPLGDKTLMTFTEQGAFLLDPADAPQREQGTQFLMDAVEAFLASETGAV